MPGTARQRKNHNGTITYQARWRPPGDGRDAARRTKTFDTKRDAMRWIAAMEADAHAGRFVDPRHGRHLFEQIADEWLMTKADLEPSTLADYTATIRTWFVADRDPLGRRPPFTRRIGAITPAQIDEWVRHLAANRSHRTLIKIWGVLTQIMAFAERRSYIALNPCSAIQLPRRTRAEYDPQTGDYIDEPEPDITALTRDEINRLADAMPTPAYHDAIIFASWMGLRAGELWGLQRRDVDLLHNIVHIRRAFKEVNGSHRGTAPRHFLGPLKTRAARRDIHMPPQQIGVMMAEYLAANPGPANSFVFTTPDGEPVRHSSFYRRTFKPAVERTLPHKSHLRFHDLRHTAASFILALPHANLFLVKQRLGHEKIETTINVYGHLVPDVDSSLALALDEFAAKPANVVKLPQ